MSSEHRQSYLAGRSARAERVTELLSATFDLAVVVSSWEPRCRSVTEATGLHADLGLVLLFDRKDNKGLREQNDRILLEYCSAHCGRFERVTGDASDLDCIWDQILAHTLRLWRIKGYPLRIFVDLTTCPRYYALGLLAECVSRGIANHVTLFYAEGLYPEGVFDGSGKHEWFTLGRWRTVAIPGLQGEYAPGKSRFYLVSVGAEGWKTLRAVTRGDPDRISILFPNPGVRQEYVEMAQHNNQELIEQYRVPSDQFVQAYACDAIAAWKALGTNPVERCERENTYYLCCGTKPHSLALALRALSLGGPAVLYNVPDQHGIVETEPAGTYWRFDITDVTALPRSRGVRT